MAGKAKCSMPDNIQHFSESQSWDQILQDKNMKEPLAYLTFDKKALSAKNLQAVLVQWVPQNP